MTRKINLLLANRSVRQDWLSNMKNGYFALQQAQANAQMTRMPTNIKNGDFVVNINSSNLSEKQLKRAMSKVYQ